MSENNPQPTHAPGEGQGGMPYEFDEARLERLRDPDRLVTQNPERIWSVLADRPPRTLVDLGTGIGFCAIPFARRLPDGLLYACDVKEEALRYLREAIRREGVTNIVPVLSEPVYVPLEDAIADVVVMINLHHHLPSRPGTLAQCRRLLRMGGKVTVIDWKTIPTAKGPPQEARIPPAKVRAELHAAGFQAVVEHDVLPEHYIVTGLK